MPPARHMSTCSQFGGCVVLVCLFWFRVFGAPRRLVPVHTSCGSYGLCMQGAAFEHAGRCWTALPVHIGLRSPAISTRPLQPVSHSTTVAPSHFTYPMCAVTWCGGAACLASEPHCWVGLVRSPTFMGEGGTEFQVSERVPDSLVG
jgi:hypothetical protein